MAAMMTAKMLPTQSPATMAMPVLEASADRRKLRRSRLRANTRARAVSLSLRLRPDDSLVSQVVISSVSREQHRYARLLPSAAVR
jgi:hypothetical protein